MRQQHFFSGFVVFCMCAFLIACGSVKTPSEDNFKKATEAYLDSIFPYGYIEIEYPYIDKSNGKSREYKFMEFLFSKGLVTKSEDVDKNGNKYIKYEFGEEVKKYHKTYTDRIAGERSVLSFGKPSDVKIINFTEPADAFGRKISQVNFTYVVNDIPEWANNEEVIQVSRGLKEALQSKTTPIEKRDTFVLTEKGWVHKKMSKK